MKSHDDENEEFSDAWTIVSCNMQDAPELTFKSFADLRKNSFTCLGQ